MKRYSNLDMTGNQITRVVIELVSTLPVTDLNIGRIVYLTTDDKFYGYTSNGWKEVTPDMFPGYAYLDPADDNTKQITKWSEPGTTPDAEDDGAKAVDEHSHKDDYVTAAQVATTLINLRRFDDPSIDNTKNHYGYPVYDVNGQLTSIDTTKIVADYQWSDLLKNRMMIPRIAANGSVVESPFFVDGGWYKLTTRDQWETMIPTSGCVIENIKHMAEYILGVAYANLGNGIFATNSSGETIWISTTAGSAEEKLLSVTSNGVQVQLNVTTTVDSNSTDTQIPTAKAVYDALSSSSGLDDAKINVIDDEITLHTFDTLSDAKDYIDSNNKPKSVIIGSNAGVTSIGDGTFEMCESLTSITIPDSVTSIGDNAFRNCTSLTSITIPDSVTSIGNNTFDGCTSLTSITIPDNVTSICNNTFRNCTSLTSITIPDSVTSIDSSAFDGCTSLISITIPDNVTSIGNSVFSGCTSLTSINIPSSVTSIGNDAFSGCDILLLDNYKSRTGYPWGATDILIHNENVTTTINENSTDRQVPTANSVYNFIIENMFSIKFDMEYLKEYIERTITSINISDSVTSIGDGAFRYCKSLTSINIPDSVTSIGRDAFRNCTSLTSITIPDSVTIIGSGTFYGCKSLTSITIPSSVTSISSSAFENCKSLTSITIPDSVTKIGDAAFRYCTSLTSITIPDSVTKIGSGAFENCTSLTSINIPDSVIRIGSSAFSGCKSLTSITIPDSVTSIGYDAFRYCTSLTSITIPDSVTIIGDDAFASCTSLTSISIPSSVTSIGSGTFASCTSLTSINIPSSVTSIGNDAFASCTSLTSITIPSSVTRIGRYAFGSRSITSITINKPEGSISGAPWGATNATVQWTG